MNRRLFQSSVTLPVVGHFAGYDVRGVCEVVDRDDDVLQNIIAYLDELEGFRELWYKFQSDACYCDESEAGEACLVVICPVRLAV